MASFVVEQLTTLPIIIHFIFPANPSLSTILFLSVEFFSRNDISFKLQSLLFHVAMCEAVFSDQWNLQTVFMNLI